MAFVMFSLVDQVDQLDIMFEYFTKYLFMMQDLGIIPLTSNSYGTSYNLYVWVHWAIYAHVSRIVVQSAYELVWGIYC